MKRSGARPWWSLLAGLLLSDAVFLWVVARLTDDPVPWVCAWAAVLAPVLIPAYPAARARLRIPDVLAPLLYAVQLVALTGFVRPTVLALAVLAMLQTHLWLRSSESAAAGWCLAIGPLVVMVSMALVPSPWWGAVFPLSLFLAAVSALGLQDRAARRHAERSNPLRRFGLDATDNGDSKPHPARSIGYALPLSILVLGALSAIFLAAMAMPKPWQSVWDLQPRRKPPKDWQNEFTQEATSEPPPDQFVQTFPSELNYSGGVSQLVQKRVMEVRPVGGREGEKLPYLKPIYLRGRVMDTFTVEGTVFGAELNLEPMEDARDGREDGWTQLEELASWERAVELSIRQQPLLAENGRYGILFAPEPVSAIAEPRVLWDRNGLLLSPEPPTDWFQYRVRYTDRRLIESRVREARAVFWDSRYLQMPPENDGYLWLGEQAQLIARGAPSDFERVLRVVRYFKDNFDYSLKSTDFPGLEGVIDFLQGRRGHCTYFATAAVLMLRSLDIPCRVATGFITAQWSNSLGAYPITTKNGHAWIEVYFRGIGWVTMDPTPMDRRAAAFAALERRNQAGIGEWMAGVLDEFSQWASSGGDVIYFKSMLEALAEGPRALRRSLGESSMIFWGVLASFVTVTGLQLLWRLLRRRRGDTAKQRDDPSLSAYQRLLRELAKHGFHKGKAQTPREFAHVVAEARGEQFALLQPLTERFYRVRFGGAPWGEDEEELLEDFLEGLSS